MMFELINTQQVKEQKGWNTRMKLKSSATYRNNKVVIVSYQRNDLGMFHSMEYWKPETEIYYMHDTWNTCFQ